MRGTDELPICLHNLRADDCRVQNDHGFINPGWWIEGPPNSVVHIYIYIYILVNDIHFNRPEFVWIRGSHCMKWHDPAYFDAVNFSTKWHGFRWILQAPDILGIAIGWHMRLFRNCNNLLHRLYFRHLSPNLSCLPQSKKKETITYKYAVCRAQHTVVQASL